MKNLDLQLLGHLCIKFSFVFWKNWRHQKDISNFLTWCFSSCHPKILADQLTWSQLGWGTDYTHHITKYWSSRIFRPSSYSPSKVITVSPLDRNLPVNPTGGALLKYSLFGFVIWKSNLELTLHRTPWRTVW